MVYPTNKVLAVSTLIPCDKYDLLHNSNSSLAHATAYSYLTSILHQLKFIPMILVRQLSETLTIRIELPSTEHIGYCGAKKDHFHATVTSHSHKMHFSQWMKKVFICRSKKSLIPFRKFKLWYKPCRINFDVRSIAYT